MPRALLLLLLTLVAMPRPGRGEILSFVARDDFPTGPSPRSAVAARVNDDEYTDLVVADDDGVSILFGTPVGRLSAPLGVPTEVNTHLLAVSDLDADGRADLAYADSYGSPIVLRRGDGSGGFAPWKTLDLGERPSLLIAGDLDGDGRTDLLTSSASGITAFLNDGSGSFLRKQSPAEEPSADGRLADISGDGLADLLLTSSERRQLWIMLNLGHGRFAAAQKIDLPLPASGLAMIQADGDERLDLAVMDARGIYLLRRVGATSATPGGAQSATVVFADPERLYESTTCKGVAAGDLNRDGRADLVVLDEERGILLVLRGDGSGKFGASGAYDIGRADTAVLTFERGGERSAAVAALNRRGSSVVLMHAVADGSLSGTPVFGAGEGPIGGVAANLNLDPYPDLVVADHKAGAVLVYLGGAHGRFRQSATVRVGRGTKAIAVADFDRDGAPDIAAVNELSDDVAVLSASDPANATGATMGRNFSAPVLLNTGVGPVAIASLDANQDGSPDLAVANRGSRSVSLLVSDGHGGFADTRNFPLPLAPDFLIAGDLNHDGHADLVVGERDLDHVYVLNGTAAGLAEPKRSDKGEEVRPSIASDFDRDGHLDLAIVDPHGDRIGILLGSGLNVFAEAVYFPVSSKPSALIAGDFNHDERPDLVVLSPTSRTILLLINDSSSAETPEPGAPPAPTAKPDTKGPDGSPWGGRLRSW